MKQVERFIYRTKLVKNEFATANNKFDFKLEKPHYCPICMTPQEGSLVDRKLWNVDDDVCYGTVMYRCNSCGKKYLVNYNLSTKEKHGSFGSFYPVLEITYENPTLQKVSPGFMDLYAQASHAEYNQDLELAATGYRNALEFLVKDFAIVECGANPADVKKKTLFQAIGDYLPATDLIKSADVIRILGNDFTHYDRKHPNLDFDLLTKYMEIFVNLIETQIMLNHPPVSR